MNGPLARGLLLLLALSPLSAQARPEAAQPPPDRDAIATSDEPLLPARLARPPHNFWTVGLATERFGAGSAEEDVLGNQLVGLTAMWRIRSFGPYALLMTKPAVSEYQNSRFLFGGGLRGVVDVPGLAELSYGVGAHLEARLRDHYWLAYVTPLELGATLYRKGSWHLELFVGARRVAGGALIDHFLIDPNGVDNEDAQDRLDEQKHERPWKGFVRLVFARRID